jgi:nucleoid-associated protein YgaU
MALLLRWTVVLLVLYFGVSGLMNWWSPTFEPTAAQVKERSVSWVEMHWQSDPTDGTVSEEETASRPPNPERVEPYQDPQKLEDPRKLEAPREKTFVYTVLTGDTLGEIAVRFLGTARAGTREIRKLNPEIGADGMIVAGQELIIPTGSEAEVQAPQEIVQSPRFHVVQEGDTLSGIARQYLGHENYEIITRANRDVLPDPNLLKIGMRLRIPNE